MDITDFDKPINVKQFIEQKVMGYSDDYKQTHTAHLVEMKDGAREIVYSSSTTHRDGTISSGTLTRAYPFVVHPLGKETE